MENMKWKAGNRKRVNVRIDRFFISCFLFPVFHFPFCFASLP